MSFRGHDTNQAGSPKPPKPWLSVTLTRPIRSLLRQQRLLFLLLGIALATFFFTLFPSSSTPLYQPLPLSSFEFDHESTHWLQNPVIDPSLTFRMPVHSRGKIPLGITRKGLRIVVTGGAGFVGSHLVDRLIARGDSVIVVDNFFTGRKENVVHHFGNPRFELIRHDVVEPLLLEVDQIYHLACPASPVHYKFNPVKTIISFSNTISWVLKSSCTFLFCFCNFSVLDFSSFLVTLDGCVHKTNVVGTLNMLGLAKRVGARFLLTSTSEVYGDPLQHPQKETYWGNVNPIGW